MRLLPPLLDGSNDDESVNEAPIVSARADHWIVLRGLLPFVWPQGRPDLRVRVVVAFAVLLLAINIYEASGAAGLTLPFVLGLGMALPWPFAGIVQCHYCCCSFHHSAA